MGFFAAMLLPLALSTYQGNDIWKAGIAVVKITPDVPLQMSGYASRTKPYEGIVQNLTTLIEELP